MTKLSKKNKISSKINFNLVKKLITRVSNRLAGYLSRRPHRSFRYTRRRDYVNNLKLPGYIKFTKFVFITIWENRRVFLLLALFYAVFTGLLVGLASQDTYSVITGTMSTASGNNFSSFLGEIGKAGLLFISTATGGLNGSLSESQQIFGIVIILMAWLTNVWLLRNILAGHKLKLRDGLYNSGAPILPMFLIALVLIIQLLPAALALIGYGAASTTGLLNSGVEAMLFWFAAGLLVLISLYFIVSTVFAMIIVTLPGMYPFKAIRIAGDLVLGKRVRILMRFIWLFVITLLVWAVIMIPIILFDGWIKNIYPVISWLPIVPIFLLILSSLTVVWVSSYTYLLYRKVVDNDH
jgi:hypothetical protein